MLGGKDYLCTVGYYSGYFAVGPPFSSAEFANFVRSALTEHITSSPLHAPSNGRVGNSVKLVKILLKKSKETKFYLSLLSWRNTPT